VAEIFRASARNFLKDYSAIFTFLWGEPFEKPFMPKIMTQAGRKVF